MGIVMDDIIRLAKEQNDAYLRAYQAGFDAGYKAGIEKSLAVLTQKFPEARTP